MLEKEYSFIVMMYASHVIRGLRTLASVPAYIRAEVEACIADTLNG